MIYFLIGDSAPLQIKYEEIIQKIKKENHNIPEKIFDASQGEITSFFDSASTNSMFTPKELLILKRAENIKNLDEVIKSLKLYNLNGKEIVILYEEFLNDFGKITNKLSDTLLKKIEEIAKITIYRHEKETKATVYYIQQELNISEGEAEKLNELIGNDYFKLKNEVEKIKNFLDGDIFSLDKVKPILSISQEHIFKNLLEEFLTTKKSSKLLSYLQKEQSYLLFIKSLVGELTIYLNIFSLINSGILNPNCYYNNFKDKIYSNIKELFLTDTGYLHAYIIFLKLKNINNFTEDFLIDKIKELAMLDYKIKSGKIDIDTGVEVFILNFFKK